MDRVLQIMAASGSVLNKEMGNVANVILFGISSGKFQFGLDLSSEISFKKIMYFVDHGCIKTQTYCETAETWTFVR